MGLFLRFGGARRAKLKAILVDVLYLASQIGIVGRAIRARIPFLKNFATTENTMYKPVEQHLILISDIVCS